jgi:hypothetical protein
MADKSPIARIKELEDARNKLISTTKAEALGRANQAVADLLALGFKYHLIDEVRLEDVKIAKKGSRKRTGTIKDAPCPICEFKTKPPHDRRAHRFSKAKRRPFNAADLKEKGYTKV